ncbi:MAG: hypothetical protein RLZZ507_3737 [Cyanobacteriota bacterium]|jgi:uncharacterized membrane protein
MRNVKLNKLWDALHSSYWFLPGMMTLLGVGLAMTMLTLDNKVGFKDVGWIYAGGPDGAREVLSAIASSMMSVAATAFSITIVALQLASRNFGPRLLRNFMRDTGNQIVLGTFLATFIYSLLVLRTIYGEDYNLFIPHLSVTVGILLAIFSIGVLIYFIHHASTIIQASHVLESVSNDLYKCIDRLFPEKIGYGKKYQLLHYLREIPVDFDLQSYPIQSHKHGYLQLIDDDGLMKIACDDNILIYIKSRPGKFIVKGKQLVRVWPGEKVNHKLTKKIRKVFLLGKERTQQQDVCFPILQLVEIALRAISPSVNDPFTAIYCIDRLCGGICQLVQREFPSAYRYDEDNKLRVIAEPVSFKEVVNDAFDQIRQNSRSQKAVTIHLLDAIAIIASFTQNPHYHSVLRHHADMINNGSQESLPEAQDRKDVQQTYNQVIQALAKDL